MFPSILLGYYRKRVSPRLGIRLKFTMGGKCCFVDLTSPQYKELPYDSTPCSIDLDFQTDSTTDVRLARTTKKPPVRPRVFPQHFKLLTNYLCRFGLDDNEFSTRFPPFLEWNDLSNSSNLTFALNDGYDPSVVIDTETSPFVPEPLIGTFYRTKAYQTQSKGEVPAPDSEISLTFFGAAHRRFLPQVHRPQTTISYLPSR